MSHMSAGNPDLLPPASLQWGVMKNIYCEFTMAYMRDFENVFDYLLGITDKFPEELPF